MERAGEEFSVDVCDHSKICAVKVYLIKFVVKKIVSTRNFLTAVEIWHHVIKINF